MQCFSTEGTVGSPLLFAKLPYTFGYRKQKKMEAEKIKILVNPILESGNLFLVDLKVSKDNVIELLIDSQQGVNIQTCIDISKEIENKLDREEEDFELTVSSAGIGYPFKVEGQFQKNLGKTVEVKLNDQTKLTGLLKNFDPGNIWLEYEEKQTIAGKKKKQICKIEKQIPRNEIKEIRDIVSFK